MIATLVPVHIQMPTGAPRSLGVHLSGIIRCMAIETGILKPEWIEELSLVDASQQDWWDALDPVSRLRISIGIAWEQWYIPKLRGVIDHPGEMYLDGVYMTHDGESLDVIITIRNTEMHILAVHEVKATYKSIKTVAPRHVTGSELDPADLETQWMWVEQVKGYCKGLGTNVAYLHVLFLCSDYKFPIVPSLGPLKSEHTCWRIEFDQAEIDQSWEEKVEYVKYRKAMELEEQS